MNPLYRKMFRQPGASRQASGILASSPELVNVVQRRQPVQMANGGDATYMAAIQSLAKKGDVETLMNISRDDRLSRQIRNAAVEAVRNASRRKQDTTQIATVPSASFDESVSPEPTGDKSFAETIGVEQSTIDQLKRSFMYPGEVIGMGAPADAPGKPSSVGQGIRRFFFGTDSVQSPVQSALRSVDSGIRSMESSLDKAGRATSAGVRSLFTPVPTSAVDTEGGVGGVDGELADVTIGNVGSVDTEGGVGGVGGELADVTVGETLTSNMTTPRVLPKPKPEKPKSEKPDPIGAAEKLVTDPTDLLPQISSILKQEGSEKEKADAVDQALDIKGTRKQRIEQRYQMLKDLLGEKKADDIRTDKGYNLMMTGLLIAAGGSPDAGINIAKGLAAGLKGYGEAAGEAAQEAAKEEKALKLMAAKEIGEEITAETAAEAKAKETEAERDLRRELLNTKLGFTKLENETDRDYRERMQDEKINAEKELKQMPGETQRLIEKIAREEGISLWKAAAFYKSLGKTTTGQAYTPKRFAQMSLDTAADREQVALEMMTKFPKKYDPRQGGTPPTIGDMQRYIISETSGERQQPQSLVGQDKGPYGATTVRNGKNYVWNKATGKYDPQ